MNREQQFKQLCIAILAQSGNCADSQRDFSATSTIQEMCGAWRKYWHGMLTEVPQQVVSAFDEYYPDFKVEINEAGIYYNEDSRLGIVIVGNSDEPVHLTLARNAYALGKAHVVLHNQASIISMHPDATIESLDSSNAHIRAGYGIARNRSTLTTQGDAECYDASTIHITNGTLHDHGHLAITAYGTAQIDGFTHRNITLYDTSTLTIRP